MDKKEFVKLVNVPSGVAADILKSQLQAAEGELVLKK